MMKYQIKHALLVCTLLITSQLLMAQAQRSNIIMIVVDDMRYDEWSGGGHTFLKTPNIDKLAAEGTTFTRAYHAVPLCSPNRASILTGQYPSRHGIIDNTSRNQASFMLDLFPKYLQASGYKTAHVGKWHMGNSPMPRPGYDYWLCMEGQGKTYNPPLYEGEQRIEFEGYITDIFTDKAIDFIKGSADQPFFLYIGHKAVHPEAIQRDDGTTDLSVPKTFIAADRHKGNYTDTEPYERSKSYSPTGTVEQGKPVIENAFTIRQATMDSDERWIAEIDLGTSEKSIRDRAEMMLGIDESMERIIATLLELDIEDNTTIIFTSDNGYFFGEHGFSLERRMPYEESVKTPLIIKSPNLSNAPRQIDALTLSIDLSATALDIANVDIPSTIQGKSLLPLLTGLQTDTRQGAFIEYFSNENPFPWTAQLDYRVVVTEQYKYIKWLRFEEAELYDLSNDPEELINLIDDPGHQQVVTELHQQMEDLQLQALGLR
ncbi:MAG: sulfatase-like hydrolase/transferase [Cyclobacteriaceae bacterium]